MEYNVQKSNNIIKVYEDVIAPRYYCTKILLYQDIIVPRKRE